MHARGQNKKRRITANRLETRRVACALVIRGCRISSTRADTSSSTMCCGFRFKDSNREAHEECARSRRQSRERPRTRSIGSFIPMRRSGRKSRSIMCCGSESLDAKIDYVLQNPVRKGLVRIAREYPWSWRKPMDHQDRSRRGGGAHPPPRGGAPQNMGG